MSFKDTLYKISNYSLNVAKKKLMNEELGYDGEMEVINTLIGKASFISYNQASDVLLNLYDSGMIGSIVERTMKVNSDIIIGYLNEEDLDVVIAAVREKIASICNETSCSPSIGLDFVGDLVLQSGMECDKDFQIVQGNTWLDVLYNFIYLKKIIDWDKHVLMFKFD